MLDELMEFHQYRSRAVFVKAGFHNIQIFSAQCTDWDTWGKSCLGLKSSTQIVYELLALGKYTVIGAI